MGESVSEAQSILGAVHRSSKRHGLEISKEKTKVLLVAKEPAEVVIKIDDYKLEQVTHFKYLGTEVTDQNISTTDLRCRTAQALAAAGNLRVIWRNTGISLKTKLRLLDCLVLPIALYGCETWTLNKAELKKLQAFGMKCLRMVLGITWREHITNAEISSRTSRSIGYFVDIVQQRQRAWLGHVLRMEGNRLPKISIQARSLDTRYRGRPRKNWVDATLEGTGVDYKTAIHLARDRNVWRCCMRGTYDHLVTV